MVEGYPTYRYPTRTHEPFVTGFVRGVAKTIRNEWGVAGALGILAGVGGGILNIAHNPVDGAIDGAKAGFRTGAKIGYELGPIINNAEARSEGKPEATFFDWLAANAILLWTQRFPEPFTTFPRSFVPTFFINADTVAAGRRAVTKTLHELWAV